MIDYKNAIIEKVSVHHVGNKNVGEDLRFSKSMLDINDNKLKELMIEYFLSPFKSSEFYSFDTKSEELESNYLYKQSSQIFGKEADFHLISKNIAGHLFESSNHPYIKSGDLFVVYFSEICVVDEIVDAIGIFKSEDKQSFLKLEESDNNFLLNYLDGINIDKLDKGCLIFNTFKETGYKVCIVDKSGKSKEARYWSNDFLNIHPCDDDYHQTKNFLEITKDYVSSQLIEDFEVSKTDQIDMLNRSMEYFKSHDNFDKNEFESEVFQETGMIDSFRRYDDEFRESNGMQVYDNFAISPQAVKKTSKVYKSVLKLDKNFHVYIHGNRNWIEQGVERDGRKYYKLYFENES
jgi:hypothetical protein